MNNLQKIIIISLLSTAGLSWLLSAIQPDMMSLMTSYNPLLISLFTASWTASMAAMMFPATGPMVLLYNKLITNKQSGSSTVIAERQLTHTLKIILFIGIYLCNLGSHRARTSPRLVCSYEQFCQDVGN